MEKIKYSICVSDLRKKYKEKEVLKSVTFSVPKGAIYTLLGSNGAGILFSGTLLIFRMSASQR